MRYWMRVDNTDYIATDWDMRLQGYDEVSRHPEDHWDMWWYDFDIRQWVISKEKFLAEVSKQRLIQETMGIIKDGKAYDTDDRARVSLMALIQYGQEENLYKQKDFLYETLTLEEIKTLFGHVMSYTVACFKREKELRELAGTDGMTLDAILEGWPNPDLDAPPPPPPPEPEKWPNPLGN